MITRAPGRYPISQRRRITRSSSTQPSCGISRALSAGSKPSVSALTICGASTPRRLEHGIATECEASGLNATKAALGRRARLPCLPRVLPNRFRTARLMIISMPLQRSVLCQLCSRQIPRKFHSQRAISLVYSALQLTAPTRPCARAFISGDIYCSATRSIGQLCSICVLPTLGGSRMICSKRVLPLRMEGFPGTIRLTFHHTARRATRRGPLCVAIGFGISWLLSGYKI